MHTALAQELAPFTLRIGLPLSGGELVRAARARGLPVLFSANAFAQRYALGHSREGEFRGFRLPDPDQFKDLDAALDSAGFVAAVRYGEYLWDVEDYLDLVGAFAWRWWASMDYCCEPQIAADRPLRILRMAATVARYEMCVGAAHRRGLPAPMPVLQGWTVSEYLQSLEWFAFETPPALLGVGSVCRRRVHGCDGILEIVAALDRALPGGTRLHLFGVKSEALTVLAGHPRIASTDSMAWDFAARRERHTTRSIAFRIDCLDRWVARQHSRLSQGTAHLQGSFLFDAPIQSTFEALVLEALALQHADLILSRDLEYLDAVWSAKRDAATAIAIVRQRPDRACALIALDELIAGLADRIEELLTFRPSD
jgi:hypothetical protein